MSVDTNEWEQESKNAVLVNYYWNWLLFNLFPPKIKSRIVEVQKLINSGMINLPEDKEEMNDLFTRLHPENMNIFMSYVDDKSNTIDEYKAISKNNGFVYFLMADNGLIKIGKSINVERRINQMSPQLPYSIELIHQIETDDYTSAERIFHDRYKKKRKNGEWFELSDKDIEEIKAIKTL